MALKGCSMVSLWFTGITGSLVSLVHWLPGTWILRLHFGN